MHLYLIRHGQSIGNTTRHIVSGRSDTRGLTLKGKNQVLRSAWELRDTPVDAIYASPVARAQESAQILEYALSKPYHEASFLSEWNYGGIEGKRWDEVKADIPDVFSKRGKEDFCTPYQDGESMEMVARRVWGGFLSFVSDKNHDGSYILVSHMAIICTILFGLQIDDPRSSGDEYVSYIHSSGVPNASITHLEVTTNKQTIHSISRTLPAVTHSEESVQMYARAHFQKDSLKASYKQTSSITNEVYLLRSGKTLVCKVMYDQEPIRADRLARLYTHLQESTSVPAPQLLHADTSYVFLNHPVLIQDYLAGDEQTVCLERRYAMESLYADILGVLDELHAVPVDNVAPFWMSDDWDSNNYQNWIVYMNQEIDKTIHSLKGVREIEQKRDLILNKIAQIRTYLSKRTDLLVPIHGDLSPSNIIVSDESGSCRLVRLLDFERAQIGDRLWEYAYYYGWLQRDYPEEADVWSSMIRERVSGEEQDIFDRYVVLFHAWTVRDMLTYKGNENREHVGVQSLRILAEI